jgi:PAS domain S-box-containing protein
VANLYSENGHDVIQCNIRDITQRKLAQDVLRRSEALFSTLIEQAPVGVYVVDRQLRLLQVNPKAQPLFKNSQPVISRDFPTIIHRIWPKQVAAEIVSRFRHTLQTGQPFYSPEFSERRRDTGLTEFYEWQLQCVVLPGGEQGVVCFFSDLTERKQAEGAQRRLEVVAATNRKLELEIARRQVVEKSLKQSEQQQTRLLKQSRSMQEQLRSLSRQVLQAQEDERKRISRELHDVIAQTLTGINIRLAALKEGAGLNPQDFNRDLELTQKLVENSVNIVHQFARELRPAVLDDLGLIPALHSFMKNFTAQTGVHSHLTAFAGLEQLDSARRTILYRVAQEALTNVSRHAQASRVEVTIQKLADAICMKINDNGKSFNVEHLLQGKGGKRLGLLGMRERLEMVGGRFEIESASGQGTTVTAVIPLTTTNSK